MPLPNFPPHNQRAEVPLRFGWFAHQIFDSLSHEKRDLQILSIQRIFSCRMNTTANQTKHAALSDYIVTDREILGGEPVFRGTRVPVASLFEHLESDCSLDEFLENFPTVTRAAAVAVLMGAQELTLEEARR
jgi:uncharacterized protein (DUF433 family)